MDEEKLLFWTSRGWVYLSPREIAFCLANNGWTKNFLENGEVIEITTLLKNITARLPQEHFIRCHRSYLVNKHFIHKIHGNFDKLELKTNDQIPVSDRKRNEVKRKLKSKG